MTEEQAIIKEFEEWWYKKYPLEPKWDKEWAEVGWLAAWRKYGRCSS